MRLYKYQPMNERRLDNLSRNQLYFRNPCDFSDPDDCKIHIYYEGTEKDWIEHYKKNHGYSEKKIVGILKKGIEDDFFQKTDSLISYDPMHKRHTKEYQDSLHGGIHSKNLPLVTCFCGTCDNDYMWENYADNHKGFCLCFKPNSTNNQIYKLTINSKEEIVYPVRYEEMPQNRLNLLSSDDVEKIGSRLITKGPTYKPENEYRMLLRTKRNLNMYKRKELESIIFGYNADKEKEKEIYAIAKRIYGNILFYKVVDIQNRDEIKIKAISTGYFSS